MEYGTYLFSSFKLITGWLPPFFIFTEYRDLDLTFVLQLS